MYKFPMKNWSKFNLISKFFLHALAFCIVNLKNKFYYEFYSLDNSYIYLNDSKKDNGWRLAIKSSY